jgi:hypothetical protein
VDNSDADSAEGNTNYAFTSLHFRLLTEQEVLGRTNRQNFFHYNLSDATGRKKTLVYMH